MNAHHGMHVIFVEFYVCGVKLRAKAGFALGSHALKWREAKLQRISRLSTSLCKGAA